MTGLLAMSDAYVLLTCLAAVAVALAVGIPVIVTLDRWSRNCDRLGCELRGKRWHRHEARP